MSIAISPHLKLKIPSIEDGTFQKNDWPHPRQCQERWYRKRVLRAKYSIIQRLFSFSSKLLNRKNADLFLIQSIAQIGKSLNRIQKTQTNFDLTVESLGMRKYNFFYSSSTITTENLTWEEHFNWTDWMICRQFLKVLWICSVFDRRIFVFNFSTLLTQKFWRMELETWGNYSSFIVILIDSHTYFKA